jgi:hypothetical protein
MIQALSTAVAGAGKPALSLALHMPKSHPSRWEELLDFGEGRMSWLPCTCRNLILPVGSGYPVRRRQHELNVLRRSRLLRHDARLCCFDWPIWV